MFKNRTIIIRSDNAIIYTNVATKCRFSYTRIIGAQAGIVVLNKAP